MQKDLEENKKHLAQEESIFFEIPYAKMTRTELEYQLENLKIDKDSLVLCML